MGFPVMYLFIPGSGLLGYSYSYVVCSILQGTSSYVVFSDSFVLGPGMGHR